MIIDKAPTAEPISGTLSASWTRWFNQVYVAVAALITNFGTLQSSLTTLTERSRAFRQAAR